MRQDVYVAPTWPENFGVTGRDECKFSSPAGEFIFGVKVNVFAELMLRLSNFIGKKPKYLQNYSKEWSVVLKQWLSSECVKNIA